MDHIAHIRPADKAEQTVAEHCRQTAELAAGYAEKLGLEHTAYLAGALHDIGKLTSDFNEYIHGNTLFSRGTLDHSFAGAKYLNELVSMSEDKMLKRTAQLMGRVILSHHGLHDWITEEGEDVYELRTENEKYYAEIKNNLSELNFLPDAKGALSDASAEIKSIRARIKRLAENSNKAKETFAFYLGMFERLLQSILIDADRTDTADFMSNSRTEMKFDTQDLWREMQLRLQKKLSAFSDNTDSISLQRRDISDRCEAFSHHEVRICRLIVPTGGGKTLSSLRFAASYAAEHDMDRIIYIAPFMSILEQNSDIIKEIAGGDFFLEHHSNMLAEIAEDDGELHEYELRSEKWDSPVIATTMVQFLNSLFLGKSSAVRRMHRLSGAVIIVDEVQSVPLKCVYLFNLAMNFLSHICESTVVLCSATQPRFEELTEFPLLLDENSSMTGDHTADFEAFRRTEIIYEEQKGGFSYDEAAFFCEERFFEHKSLLCVVNTKAAASSLYQRLRGTANAAVYHLSTNMCPQHRRDVINDMKEKLSARKPVICATTQLIEAGVDISFGCVVRSLAGMDNAAQAAGRCNRHGEYDRICPVYIMELWEEKLGNLREISSAQNVSRQIFDMFDISENADYLSVSVQSDYFDKLYRANRETLRYPVKRTDVGNLINLLSLNKGWVKNKDREFCGQAFKTAGKLFQVIDNNTADVVVPYNDDAKKLISQLETAENPHEILRLLRRAQKYSVGIYEGTDRALRSSSALRMLPCGAVILDERFYDKEYGVITEGGEHEVLLF